MGMTKHNLNCLVIMTFLYRLVEVLEEYYGELNEESIRDNFVITYELFDEMMDFGYPQFTEPKILKEYICVGTHCQSNHIPALHRSFSLSLSLSL